MAKQFWRATVDAAMRFNEHNCTRVAAALSYYTIFSLPATMVIVVSVAGFFFEPEDVQGRVRREIRSVVGESGAAQVQTMIDHANRTGRGLWGTVIGSAALLLGATNVMIQLQDALNAAWDVRPEKQKSTTFVFLVQRILSIGMLLGIAFVLVVSLSVNLVMTAVSDQMAGWLPEGGGKVVVIAVNSVVTFLLIIVSFAAMFRYLPDTRIPWNDVWLGATLTACLFAVGRHLLHWYLATVDIASTFGAAGSLALILVWIYYSSIILLFGAEFTQVWARQRRAAADAASARPVE